MSRLRHHEQPGKSIQPSLSHRVGQRLKEYPLAWVSDYGGTRIFGTMLGHGNDTWNDPVFQDLLARAFKWAVKRE